MGWRDDWPSMPDGGDYDGKRLLTLSRTGRSPFQELWDVNLLIEEIEEYTGTQVIDIPVVNKGSNNYGFHVKTLNGLDMVARLARGDVNMPGFEGFPAKAQAAEAEFEAAVYNLLRLELGICTSYLIYHRVPALHPGPKTSIPKDLAGRRLFLFERAEGVKNVWMELSCTDKLHLLDQLGNVRAALFNYNPPPTFTRKYCLGRIFEFMPESLSLPVAPTREFWIQVMESKINATIRNEGDTIGWEDDNETVGPVALIAKQSLLRALPHIMPPENSIKSLYRFVLEHGDFGIHNTTIKSSGGEGPLVTSLYDWETGCITPAILSDPLVAVEPVDLTTDINGEPYVTRLPKDTIPSESDVATYAGWAQHYIQVLYKKAPGYKLAIEAGRDIRHLWFALRDWHGGDSENFFGSLGQWAEARMEQLGVN